MAIPRIERTISKFSPFTRGHPPKCLPVSALALFPPLPPDLKVHPTHALHSLTWRTYVRVDCRNKHSTLNDLHSTPDAREGQGRPGRHAPTPLSRLSVPCLFISEVPLGSSSSRLTHTDCCLRSSSVRARQPDNPPL